MSLFHGCMRKNRDGSNRIIEKKINAVYGRPVVHFGKKQRTFLLKSGLAPKNKSKKLLRSQNLIDIAGEEVEKISKDGSRQTTRNSIL